jgi:AraC-like DNA-binding protein
MFKFLRKYSVWILGFGGTLLLIAFLAPNVIQRLAQEAGYAGTVQAKVGDGEEVGYEQWQQNVIESQIIDRIGGSIPGVGAVESPSHWFLLTREADLAGVTPPIQTVRLDEQTLLNIARQTGASPRTVLDAFAHLQGVQKLVQMYQSAGRFSDRRLHKAADDYFSSTSVETIVIPAIPEDNGSFSDEAMQAQLDTWANTPAGEGDHGFGYKLPDRFKTEWLVIPSDSITETARNSDGFSSREQRKFWRRNENDPRFPAIDSSPTIPEEVSNAYLEQLAAAKRKEIARSASEHLRSPRRGLDEANSILILPEDWSSKQLSFVDLATSLQEEFGIALPQYGANTEWTSTDDANSTPVIGEVLAVNQGDTPVDFRTLVSSCKEFDGSGVFRIQESIASPVLETNDGDLVLFRLTETDAARAPNNIAEVADQVSYDLGRIARWETLQAESDLIEQHARTDGMLAASLKYNSDISSPMTVSMIDTGVPSILDPETARPLMAQSVSQRIAIGNSISDMSTTIPALEQNDPELIQEIMNRTHEFPLDVPITSLPIDQQVFIVQSPENMALVLVRVSQSTPASVELASSFTGGTTAIIQTILAYDELGGVESIGDTFSFEALAARHHFERGSQNVDIETEDVEAEVN